MTCAELIAFLQTFPGDTTVVVHIPTHASGGEDEPRCRTSETLEEYQDYPEAWRANWGGHDGFYFDQRQEQQRRLRADFRVVL